MYRFSRIFAPFLLSIFVLVAGGFPVAKAETDWEGLAKSVIFSADMKIQEASQILQTFWNNATDETLLECSRDLAGSHDNLTEARQYLGFAEYNESLRLACRSLFLAARSQYRIYFNITWLLIEEVNQTISMIPWYLGKPWYALDVLQNATRIFEENNMSQLFVTEPLEADVDLLNRVTQYDVVRMGDAVEGLFTDDQSAFNLALRAKNLAASYGEEQSGVFWRILLMIAISLIAVFIIGISAGIFIGPKIRQRVSRWGRNLRWSLSYDEDLSENERRFSIAVVEASGVMVTAFLTIGALTGAVLQQVKYVYQFIGYMFAYTIPFILSAFFGILTLYYGRRSRRHWLDSFDFTIALFMTGWIGFLWLFLLTSAYESLEPNRYFIVDLPYMISIFLLSLAISLAAVFVLKRITGKRPTRYFWRT